MDWTVVSHALGVVTIQLTIHLLGCIWLDTFLGGQQLFSEPQLFGYYIFLV
jgi:hypothetical protein